jgi:hypothetical protein
MIDVILGAIALLLLLIVLREFLGADPKMLARSLRYFAFGSLLLTALGLAITERIVPAIAVTVLAFVLFARRPFWFFSKVRKAKAPRKDSRRPDSGMTRNEAFAVLGLQPGADERMILAAHRELILKNHPDVGGSSEAAARINEAKDVLLGN